MLVKFVFTSEMSFVIMVFAFGAILGGVEGADDVEVDGAITETPEQELGEAAGDAKGESELEEWLDSTSSWKKSAKFKDEASEETDGV